MFSHLTHLKPFAVDALQVVCFIRVVNWLIVRGQAILLTKMRMDPYLFFFQVKFDRIRIMARQQARTTQERLDLTILMIFISTIGTSPIY